MSNNNDKNKNRKVDHVLGGGSFNRATGDKTHQASSSSSSSIPALNLHHYRHSISFQSHMSSSSSKAPMMASGLNPDVELAVEWSPEEQAVLEDGLFKYADEPNILKYIKISAALSEKTVRDVALRCRWMTKKENGKRRKPEEFYTGKKMKDRKEKPESSSNTSIAPDPAANMGTYSLMMHHRDQNDQISREGVGGTTRHLLDENAQVFSHITANLSTYKIQENIDLFSRTRNNILAIINDMRAMPGIMSQMPPLPVSINEELANVVLPNTPRTMTYCSPSTIYRHPEWRC